MKLSIKEVRDSGPLDFEELLPADRMPLDAPDHPTLVAPVRLNVHAEAFDDEIMALIKGETRAAMECSRCLERFERPLKANLELHVPFTGADVDVVEEIRQSFLLGLPVKPLCRQDCRGLCTRCGKNLNAGPCGCSETHEESPFAALKDLKPR
jgi:uncharacterized protein